MNQHILYKHLCSFILTAAIAVGLVACQQHHNILLAMPKKQIAAFLFQASLFAEKKLKTGDMIDPGDTYMQCVNGNDFNPRECPAFYQAMVEYAQKHADYRSLTVSDLTNDNAIYRISHAFNAIVRHHSEGKSAL